MKKLVSNLLLIAVMCFSLASCNQAQKMIDAADQIDIKCNPEVLEVINGKIDATVSVTFPPEYFLPKATLEVTPVILYVGGEAVGKPFVYQGEKVADNYKTVTKNGATISEKVHFDYIPGMEKSELVGRAKVYYKGAEYEYPADIKIADGANTTYMLTNTDGSYHYLADGYQEVIPETAEAQIMYLINSSDVRNSELKSNDVKDFQEALKALAADERREVKGTEIVAYASPDGPEALNNKLSANREKSANKAFSTITKKLNAGEVSSRTIGEDWEGFQELVNNSNIEDKELILRVLSMYSDPNVREREIKNMSAVYQSLKTNILPQLRRARFITNVEYTNYTAEELADLVDNNIDVLDEPALLRAAANAKDIDAKIAIYKQAAKKFGTDKAWYNLGVAYLDKGDNNAAKDAFGKMEKKEGNCYNNVMGVLALRDCKLDEAAKWFDKVTCKHGKINQGAIDLLTGKYNDAVTKLAGTGDHNETIAYLVTNQLNKAAASIKGNCPYCNYKKAIIAARKGDVNAYNAAMEIVKKNEKLAERAANDVEFLKYR
ncbi:MAG: hypothetical protein K6G79_03240 [Bacteroidales bacterium]|nr:hypothetical protein [Bacteroidales bacterium]